MVLSWRKHEKTIWPSSLPLYNMKVADSRMISGLTFVRSRQSRAGKAQRRSGPCLLVWNKKFCQRLSKKSHRKPFYILHTSSALTRFIWWLAILCILNSNPYSHSWINLTYLATIIFSFLFFRLIIIRTAFSQASNNVFLIFIWDLSWSITLHSHVYQHSVHDDVRIL